MLLPPIPPVPIVPVLPNRAAASAGSGVVTDRSDPRGAPLAEKAAGGGARSGADAACRCAWPRTEDFASDCSALSRATIRARTGPDDTTGSSQSGDPASSTLRVMQATCQSASRVGHAARPTNLTDKGGTTMWPGTGNSASPIPPDAYCDRHLIGVRCRESWSRGPQVGRAGIRRRSRVFPRRSP